MKKTIVVLAVLVALPLVALAQKPVIQTEGVEITAKIEAIDRTDGSSPSPTRAGTPRPSTADRR